MSAPSHTLVHRPIVAKERMDRELLICISSTTLRAPPMAALPSMDAVLPNRAKLATDRQLPSRVSCTAHIDLVTRAVPAALMLDPSLVHDCTEMAL